MRISESSRRSAVIDTVCDAIDWFDAVLQRVFDERLEHHRGNENAAEFRRNVDADVQSGLHTRARTIAK